MPVAPRKGEREPMPEWAFEVVWIGGPFVLGFVLTVLTRLRWPRKGPWMALVGVAPGCAFVVWAYYTSPRSGAPCDGCSDCENYLGRWWEPQFVMLLAVTGYILWLLGIGADITAAAGINSMRRDHRKPVPGA
jgi:hypothetical protein